MSSGRRDAGRAACAARNIQGSNSIEGYEVAEDEAAAITGG